MPVRHHTAMTFCVDGSTCRVPGWVGKDGPHNKNPELWQQTLQLSLEAELPAELGSLRRTAKVHEPLAWRRQAEEWKSTGKLIDNSRVVHGRNRVVETISKVRARLRAHFCFRSPPTADE